MAVPTRDALQVESTLVGEDIRMGLSGDAEDQLHVIGVLTDMYKDRIMAPLREYSCNAFDSHIAAGFTGPIEVSLPQALSPTLRVRDYGNGLDLDEIREIYSQYGRSSKRETNELTGQLGIGSKSGLTYSSQFTVTAIKDGKKHVVSVTREETGQPMMKVVATTDTDEASGVEVSLPVSQGDYGKFEDAAEKLFRFWPEGAVLVDGQEPTRIVESAEEIVAGELYLLNDSDEENDWLVMGNIPYPVDFELYERDVYSRTGTRTVVAFVEIGDVHFTPAREELQQTTRTQRRIEKVKDDYLDAAAEKIKSSVKNAKTKGEAFREYWVGVNALGLKARPEVKYNGEAIPEKIAYDDADDDKTYTSSYRYRGTYRRNSDDIKPHQFRILPLTVGLYSKQNENTVKDALRPDDFEKPIAFVTGFFPTSFSADQRRRLDAYRDAMGKTDHVMILVKRDNLPMTDWMDGATVWDWADIRKWKDPNAKSAATSKKITGSYPAYTPGGSNYAFDVPADQLPSKDLYYVVGSKYGQGRAWSWLQEHNPKATLAIMPESREKKFLRLFPHAIEVWGAKAAVGFQAWSALTDRERDLYHWKGNEIGRELSELDPDQLDDPDLAEVIRVTKEKDKCEAKFNDLRTYHAEYFTKGNEIKTATPTELRKRYPILNLIRYSGIGGGKQAEHMTLYFNAAYADKGGSA